MENIVCVNCKGTHTEKIGYFHNYYLLKCNDCKTVFRQWYEKSIWTIFILLFFPKTGE